MDELISRQAAISLPVKPREDRYFQTQSLDDAYDYGWRSLQRCIEKLPSAQPELIEKAAYIRGFEQGRTQGTIDAKPRPKGRWIDEGFYADGHGAHAFRCSECGGHIIEYDADPFCRWCGADMREETHERL